MAFALARRSCSSACAARSRARPACRVVSNVRRHRSSLRVAAVQQDSNTDSRTPQGNLSTLQNFQKSYDRFRQKYEQSILSAGVGALSVTTYCVYNGQSPVEAAGITACATVMALVLNEALFSEGAVVELWSVFLHCEGLIRGVQLLVQPPAVSFRIHQHVKHPF